MLLTAILSTALLAAAAGQPQTFTGLITDSMCGADHKSMKITPENKCVQECVKHGSKYALLVGNNIHVLSDQQTPERFAGQKVKITGVLYEKTGIIKVNKIEAVPGNTPATGPSDHSSHGH